MHYLALLRGINVGGNHRVEMKRMKALLEAQGFTNVVTYLNSGNVFFESEESKDLLQDTIPKLLTETFGFPIPTLIKTKAEAERIAAEIPESWQNDTEQKTDIAYLFPEIDSPETIEKLPIKHEFLDIRYTPGAIVWNVQRENVHKAQLNKLVGSKWYALMTVRNVNTARVLGG